MKRVGRTRWLVLGLALLLLAACSRQPELPSPQENAQSLPFNSASHSDGISPTQAFAATSIPAGTAIVIRLQSPLSSAGSHAGDQFVARLEEPIVVQGQILAPSGIAITGRVLEARVSAPGAPGYLRLALTSVVLNGKAVDIHTSSIFSKGGSRRLSTSAGNPPPRASVGSSGRNDVQFSTGRRMTFRLIQPLPLQA
jgi:hypothetical protein